MWARAISCTAFWLLVLAIIANYKKKLGRSIARPSSDHHMSQVVLISSKYEGIKDTNKRGEAEAMAGSLLL